MLNPKQNYINKHCFDLKLPKKIQKLFSFVIKVEPPGGDDLDVVRNAVIG